MIPPIETLDDIIQVVRHQKRWRLRQRVIVLKTAQKRLNALRLSHRITAEQCARTSRELLPALQQARQRYRQLTRAETDPKLGDGHATASRSVD